MTSENYVFSVIDFCGVSLLLFILNFANLKYVFEYYEGMNASDTVILLVWLL